MEQYWAEICDESRFRNMSRVYNFSAGPACLPEEVLKEASAEMLDYRGTGMSVL
jgi:phosphoserine aminotransferase